jgi:hypothetical protein
MANRLADRMHDVPLVARTQRTGASRIEQRGVARVREHVSRMPASLVVQLALWPDELARWARAERIAESVVYNLLAGRKPYLRMRERLAAHLGVQTGHLASLVDGVIDEPEARGRRASAAGGRRRHPARIGAAAAPTRWSGARSRWWRARSRRCPRRPSWGWRSGRRRSPSGHVRTASNRPAVWATLAGTPSEIVAAGLARRLDVSVREVVALIEAERPPAGAATVFAARPAEPAAAEPPVISPPAARAPARPADPGSSTAPSARPKPTAIDQLSLGL